MTTDPVLLLPIPPSSKQTFYSNKEIFLRELIR